MFIVKKIKSAKGHAMTYIKLLIDLDGTLTDTTSEKFKNIRDIRDHPFDPQKIPLIEGAVDFVRHVKDLGHTVAIVSDSQTSYVERMANEVFGVPFLSLTDKPNTEKLRAFLLEKFDFPNTTKAEDFLFIGDTEFDIYTARRLEIPSVLLGDDLELTLGATYHCKSYQDILGVLETPATHRFVLEDKAGQQTADFLNVRNRNDGYTIFRSLARQNKGLCDKFGALKRYNVFGSATRNADFVREIAGDVSRYLQENVCARADEFSWDYITCAPDKETTIPPRKMEGFLSAIDTPIPDAHLFYWSPDIKGSIREQKSKRERLDFVDKFLLVQEEPSLNNKNVIVLDDNYTTGATAEIISEKLLNAGVQNLLFLSLFYLVDDVISEKNCPRCGKLMKFRRRGYDWQPFFSCASTQYGGTGCGYTETIR